MAERIQRSALLAELLSQAGAKQAVGGLQLGRSYAAAERIRQKQTKTDQAESQLLRAGGMLVAPGVIIFREQLVAGFKHGSWRLNKQPAPGSWLLRSDPLPTSLLFLDTETTGLGGAGCRVFMFGCISWQGNSLLLEQLLLLEPAAEYQFLECVGEILARFEAVVTYNGKSFDLPLLKDRCRMSRLPWNEPKEHLDLLYRVRRLYRNKWPDCRLQTSEKRILKFWRDQDLPGSEAPRAWFRMVRRGKADQVIKVLGHNRDDLISLVALHEFMSAIDAAGWYPENAAMAYADGLAKKGQYLKALEFALAHGAEITSTDQLSLGNWYRKAGQDQRAVSAWRSAFAGAGCQKALLALCKHCEHRKKDFGTALLMAQQLKPDVFGSVERAHRISRLRRKLAQA